MVRAPPGSYSCSTTHICHDKEGKWRRASERWRPLTVAVQHGDDEEEQKKATAAQQRAQEQRRAEERRAESPWKKTSSVGAAAAPSCSQTLTGVAVAHARWSRRGWLATGSRGSNRGRLLDCFWGEEKRRWLQRLQARGGGWTHLQPGGSAGRSGAPSPWWAPSSRTGRCRAPCWRSSRSPCDFWASRSWTTRRDWFASPFSRRCGKKWWIPSQLCPAPETRRSEFLSHWLDTRCPPAGLPSEVPAAADPQRSVLKGAAKAFKHRQGGQKSHKRRNPPKLTLIKHQQHQNISPLLPHFLLTEAKATPPQKSVKATKLVFRGACWSLVEMMRRGSKPRPQL